MQTCVAALRLPGRMSVERVAGCWWTGWPDGVECAVRELFIDNYDEYSAMILKFMDEVGIRVLAFDYNEFEVMTRHCPSEDALLSAFLQISKCAEERRIYPRLRFTDLPPR